jgi:hypothetical protein
MTLQQIRYNVENKTPRKLALPSGALHTRDFSLRTPVSDLTSAFLVKIIGIAQVLRLGRAIGCYIDDQTPPFDFT